MGRPSRSLHGGDRIDDVQGAPRARSHPSEKRRVRLPLNVMRGLKMLRCRYLT